MDLTPELLDAMTDCGPILAKLWAPAFAQAAERFAINTSRRLAAFIAQVAHESDNFRVVVENLNYSAAGLIATWPQHFNTVNAEAYAHKPVLIANRAYANRMGNGDEASGDGWKCRGRGPLQTTGVDAYRALGAVLGFDLLATPEALIQPVFGALAAAWEWSQKGCNEMADVGNFDGTTKAINGGFIGQPDRAARWARCKSALGIL